MGRASGSTRSTTDETQMFRYVQELKTWNRDSSAEDHYFFPELHDLSGPIEFTEISRDVLTLFDPHDCSL